MNKKLTAKEQAWIPHPICLLWASQLTPFPRQSPGAVWKIFPRKNNFQMAVWMTLHLLWVPQPWVFQHYFSKLPYFQTSSQVAMACSTHAVLGKHNSGYNTVLILFLTFKYKTKVNKSIFGSVGHHRTPRRPTTSWTMEQEHRNCRGKWP